MGEPLVHPIRVRYAECDPQGVVFNAHYLAWFDLSMTELFRAAFGSYDAAVQRGADIVVAHADLDFRAPARFDDQIQLAIEVARIGDSSLRCRHRVLRGDEELASGETLHVVVDPKSLQKQTVPAWLRDGLAPWSTAPADE
jgi:acyl-CoA thioester hydrolase